MIREDLQDALEHTSELPNCGVDSTVSLHRQDFERLILIRTELLDRVRKDEERSRLAVPSVPAKLAEAFARLAAWRRGGNPYGCGLAMAGICANQDAWKIADHCVDELAALEEASDRAIVSLASLYELERLAKAATSGSGAEAYNVAAVNAVPDLVREVYRLRKCVAKLTAERVEHTSGRAGA